MRGLPFFTPALLGVAALGIAACQSAGDTPVQLSDFAASGYREYSDVVGEKAFAITEDGRSYGYAYCIDTRCTGNERSAALENCESGRKRQGMLNTSCKMFAVNNTIIWRGEVSIPNES